MKTSSVHLLKKELGTASVSEQIYQHRKDSEAKQRKRVALEERNQIKETKSRLQIIHEQRRKLTEKCRRDMFLRKEKSTKAHKKSVLAQKARSNDLKKSKL